MNHDDLSATRQAKPDDLVTVSSETSTVSSLGDPAREGIMPTTDLLPRATEHRHPTATSRRYRAPMTTSAHSVITAIDLERPGLSTTKRQLLLFFVQGHHLADHGEPAFIEPMYATSDGVLVEPDSEPVDAAVGEATLGAVAYVLHRYGNLSPADLRTLVQASTAWQLGRRVGEETRIERPWLADWFLRRDEQNDPDDDRPTADMVAAFMEKRQEQATG
jgi:hypothetical protein